MQLSKRVERLEAECHSRELRSLSDEQLMDRAGELLSGFIENPAEIDRLEPGDRELLRRFVDSCER